MKKLFILCILFLLQQVQISASPKVVRLRDRIVTSGNASSRCPSEILVLEQEGYLLTMPHNEELMLVTLMKDGVVVFEKQVSPMMETIEFPEYLQGVYQISITIGNKEYVGEINF